VALYLLNCPQYVIAYIGALKVGAKVTPISPVYTSKEVHHQLIDSGAETIICEDLLYDNVGKTGLKLKNVILSNIGDYLPPLKRMFGKSALGKAYSGMQVPSPEDIRRSGLHSLKDMLKKYPPQKPAISIDPKQDIAVLPYTGGTTGQPKAAILTHHNLVALMTQTLSFWPIFEEGKEMVIAFLPFFPYLRTGSRDAQRPGSGGHDCSFHNSGYRRHSRGHGALSGFGLLWRSDTV
jgi:long-chain acyl-CoA synthetase